MFLKPSFPCPFFPVHESKRPMGHFQKIPPTIKDGHLRRFVFEYVYFSHVYIRRYGADPRDPPTRAALALAEGRDVEGISQEDVARDAEAIGRLMEAVLSVEKQQIKVCGHTPRSSRPRGCHAPPSPCTSRAVLYDCRTPLRIILHACHILLCFPVTLESAELSCGSDSMCLTCSAVSFSAKKYPSAPM